MLFRSSTVFGFPVTISRDDEKLDIVWKYIEENKLKTKTHHERFRPVGAGTRIKQYTTLKGPMIMVPLA